MRSTQRTQIGCCTFMVLLDEKTIFPFVSFFFFFFTKERVVEHLHIALVFAFSSFFSSSDW